MLALSLANAFYTQHSFIHGETNPPGGHSLFKTTNDMLPQQLMKLWLATVLGIVAFFPPGQSQTPTAESDYLLRLQFHETQRSYHTVEDPSTLSANERLYLIEQQRERQVERQIRSNGERVTNITHLRDDSRQDWMRRPQRTRIGASGVRVFDARGATLQYLPHTETYQTYQANLSHDATDWSFGADWQPLSARQLADLEASGARVTHPSEGRLEVRTGHTLSIYDYDRLYFEQTLAAVGDRPRRHLQIQFQRLTSGEVVPLWQTVRQYRTLPSGTCAEQVLRSDYRDYRIDDRRPAERGAEVSHSTASAWALHPNPFVDEVAVRIPPLAVPTVELRLYNASGQSLHHWRLATGAGHSLDLSGLSPGVYWLRGTATEAVFVQKIIKSQP